MSPLKYIYVLIDKGEALFYHFNEGEVMAERRQTKKSGSPHPEILSQKFFKLLCIGLVLFITFILFSAFFDVRLFSGEKLIFIRYRDTGHGYYLERSPQGLELWESGMAVDGYPFEFRIFP